MTPPEAIASIRASIAAGLSPSLSDIEVLIAECGRVEGLELAIKELATPDYSDEEVFALNRFHNGDRWAAMQLHRFARRAKAAITTQSPRSKNE